ncbi:MAG TPA: hypothetical protein VF466_03260 [Candidatus Saccharimonadales bacterium]
MTISATAQIERPYRQSPPYYGTTATVEEGLLHVRHEILPEPGLALRPAQVDWRAASITNSLPTAAISAGGAESLRDYITVDTRELTGSALYVIFHTLRTAGTQAVRHVQFGRGEPIPIHT